MTVEAIRSAAIPWFVAKKVHPSLSFRLDNTHQPSEGYIFPSQYEIPAKLKTKLTQWETLRLNMDRLILWICQ